jgi:hypothetical protein
MAAMHGDWLGWLWLVALAIILVAVARAALSDTTGQQERNREWPTSWLAKTHVLFWSKLAFAALSLSLLVYFSTLDMLRWISGRSVARIWPILSVYCVAAWFRGKHLDRAARNPLHGILEPRRSR